MLNCGKKRNKSKALSHLTSDELKNVFPLADENPIFRKYVCAHRGYPKITIPNLVEIFRNFSKIWSRQTDKRITYTIHTRMVRKTCFLGFRGDYDTWRFVENRGLEILP